MRTIDDEGFHIEDEKSGGIEVLSLDDIRGLIDKSVTIAFANKEDVEE